ncbi:MAG: carboxypeptidase-like regulatory domain-containing protein [Thermoanaerobaculales bacterium]
MCSRRRVGIVGVLLAVFSIGPVGRTGWTSHEENFTISGTVTGPGGAAVSGATVEVRFPWGLQGATTTDSGGRYQLSVSAGPISMHVKAPVAARLADSFVDVGFTETSFTQDFQLRSGFLLSGFVHMPGGSAAASGLTVQVDPMTFKPGEGDWLKSSTSEGGMFEVVVPAGVYWARVEPPNHYFSVNRPADLRTADVTGLVITLSSTPADPIPERPPDASKISFGPIDGLGEATVTGSPGATVGLAHVLLVNLNSLQQAYTVSEADGSFTSRIFAPPGSAILVKHGAIPAVNWDDLATGVSMKLSVFPGTILVRSHTQTGGGAGIPFATVGTSDYITDFDPTTINSVSTAFALTGTLEPSDVLNPGDEFSIQATVRVYGPGIDASSDLIDAGVSGSLMLRMVADSSGRPVTGSAFMSTTLTPTGFPIQGIKPPDRHLQAQVAAVGFTSSGSHSADAQLVVSAKLPNDLPSGTFIPALFLTTNGFPSTGSWLASEVYPSAFESPQLTLPPITVGTAGGGDRRLIWRLLMENPTQGTRGAGAQEDRGWFEFAQQIVSQGAPFLVPPVDERGRSLTYRLEPYLPMFSWADRRIPGRPLIPLQLPGGSLNVIVEEPDGTVRDLGTAEFVQSLSRSVATGSGRELNPGTTQIDDLYSLTTMDDRFEVTFGKYGRNTVTMQGSADDIWGHTFQGGGVYDVWVAHELDMDPGVLPGTPLAVGDVFNPAVQVYPRVPAGITLKVTVYPDSDPTQATTRTVEGVCNEYGLFSPGGEGITFDAPGEYRVDLTAMYWTPGGVLYMGAMTWGGVVMTPPAQAQLVAHGRRGLDSLEKIPDQSWFVSGRDLDIPAGSISHTYNPYYRGDMLWTRFSDVDAGIADGGDSLVLGASVQDTVGDIAQAITTRGALMKPEIWRPGTLSERIQASEIPLFSSTTSGYSPLLAPGDVDQIAYSYRSSQRPGVRVREVVAEDTQSGGYWRLDTLYDNQLGVGVLGDQPNDFKFQYLGIVYRDLTTGHSEYLGYGSGWIFIPDSDPLGSRAMPPFAGAGNGGWTTDGGPILTLKGTDIDIFILPTGVRPGAILEVGDMFRFGGHIMPTLNSRVAVTVTSPKGVQHDVNGQADSVGYFYDNDDDFLIDEPGLWTVDVTVWHDGLCSGGQTTSPYPSGDVLGSDQGRYWFYVVEPGEERLTISSPTDGWMEVDDPIDPITITGSVPTNLTNVTVDYTISMPGFILEHGQATVSGGSFTFDFDPVALQQDFPNLDLYGREENRVGLSDTVSIGLLLEGTQGDAKVYRANTVTLQGQQVYVGRKQPTPPPPPRRARGRVSP